MVSNPRAFGLGYLHSFFCIGAFISPLLCQTLTAHGWPWQRFYYCSSVLSASNLILLRYAFQTSRLEFIADKNRASESINMIRRGAMEVIDSESAENNVGQASRHNLPRSSRSHHTTCKFLTQCTHIVFMSAVATPGVWVFGFFVSMYAGRCAYMSCLPHKF